MAGHTGPAMKGAAMAWSIADVARMSGATSRTLRHYGEVGLLAPAYIGSNGHRYYGVPDRLASRSVTGSPALTPCRTCASTSAPRITRGPGRLKYAGPSSTHT